MGLVKNKHNLEYSGVVYAHFVSKKVKMKKICLLSITLLLAFTIINCKGKSHHVRFATGGVLGTYYTYGNEIVRILSKETKINGTVQSTGASKANIQLVSSGVVEFAIAQNDVMDYAWRGVDLFSGQQTKTFYAVAALYTEACQIVANPASGIKTVADLKGKNVSVGNHASGTEFNSRQILEAYGINFDQINKEYMDFDESSSAMLENRIDAFFCVAGAPTPAISDLSKKMEIVILEIEDEQISYLMEKYPFYSRHTIPAGSYDWQHNAIHTAAVKATLIVNSSVDEDLVYRLTKALFENKAKIEAAHIKGGELDPTFAVESISVPFHPGAQKYYIETGILKRFSMI